MIHFDDLVLNELKSYSHYRKHIFDVMQFSFPLTMFLKEFQRLKVASWYIPKYREHHHCKSITHLRRLNILIWVEIRGFHGMNRHKNND